MPPPFRLTFRQVEFCRHYALGKSARLAAETAGYTHQFAVKKSHLLLRHPAIIYKIREIQHSATFVSGALFGASIDKLNDLMNEGAGDTIKLRAASAIARIFMQQPLLPERLTEGMEDVEDFTRESQVMQEAARQAREGDPTLAHALLYERAALLSEDIQELTGAPLPPSDGTDDMLAIRRPEDIRGTVENLAAELKKTKEEKQKRIEAFRARKQQKLLARAEAERTNTTPITGAQRAAPEGNAANLFP